MTTALGPTAEQSELFHFIIENAIEYFDEMLGLKFGEFGAVAAQGTSIMTDLDAAKRAPYAV